MFLLVAAEWTLVLVFTMLIAWWFPTRICSFTCEPWVNTVFTLIIRLLFMMVILLIRKPEFSLSNMIPRILAVGGLCLLMSWVTAVDYNALHLMTKDKQGWVKYIFIGSWIVTTLLLVIAYLVIPYLLPFAGLFQIFSILLLLGMSALVSWALFVRFEKRSEFIVYFTASLVIFIPLLFSDLVVFQDGCKKMHSPFSCDPLVGSTTTYLTLLNILQNLFNLSSNLILI